MAHPARKDDDRNRVESRNGRAPGVNVWTAAAQSSGSLKT
jgi:hypothetical protein